MRFSLELLDKKRFGYGENEILIWIYEGLNLKDILFENNDENYFLNFLQNTLESFEFPPSGNFDLDKFLMCTKILMSFDMSSIKASKREKILQRFLRISKKILIENNLFRSENKKAVVAWITWASSIFIKKIYTSPTTLKEFENLLVLQMLKRDLFDNLTDDHCINIEMLSSISSNTLKNTKQFSEHDKAHVAAGKLLRYKNHQSNKSRLIKMLENTDDKIIQNAIFRKIFDFALKKSERTLIRNKLIKFFKLKDNSVTPFFVIRALLKSKYFFLINRDLKEAMISNLESFQDRFTFTEIWMAEIHLLRKLP